MRMAQANETGLNGALAGGGLNGALAGGGYSEPIVEAVGTRTAPIVEAVGIHKRFLGCEALRGADMAIPAGQIVGLLGPNASGKTTLLKIVAGLLQPSAGQVRYRGGALPGPAARASVSFCPDAMAFPGWMRARDAFAYYRDMYPDYSQGRADRLAGILDLQGALGEKIGSLSKGMKERLVLGLTYARDTGLYLLDEPLDGIDPVGKARVIDAILAMQPEGSSTLVSTHQVKDIERVIDSVYFLSKGKVIFSGSCDEMRGGSGRTVEQAYLEVFTREESV